MKTYLDEERLQSITKILGQKKSTVLSPVGKPYTLIKCGNTRLVSVCHTLVEGVHFSLLHMNAWELGYKAVSVAVTKTLANGSKPTHVSITLGIRQDSSIPFIREYYRGLKKAADECKVAIIGCETVDSPSFLFTSLNVTAKAPKKLIDPGGAKTGDVLALTGSLGLAAIGMNCLKHVGRPKLYQHQNIVTAYLTPKPRIEEAKILCSSSAVHSIVMVEGGLSSEVHTLCEASKRGALITEEKVEVEEDLIRGAKLIDANAIRMVFYGPEDFQYLVAIAPDKFKSLQNRFKRKKLKLTAIGEIKSANFDVKLDRVDGQRVVLEAREWHPMVRRQTA